jgi:hypothetical protein
MMTWGCDVLAVIASPEMPEALPISGPHSHQVDPYRQPHRKSLGYALSSVVDFCTWIEVSDDTSKCKASRRL